MSGTIVDDDAFLARAAVIAEHAREGLVERRKHPPLVFFWLPTNELSVSPLQKRFEPERRAWSRVAREAAAGDARGILFVGEGWADDGEGALAESLIASALTRSGRARTEITPFVRRKGRAIQLGEPRVIDEPGSFLEAVQAAWAAETSP